MHLQLFSGGDDAYPDGECGLLGGSDSEQDEMMAKIRQAVEKTLEHERNRAHISRFQGFWTELNELRAAITNGGTQSILIQAKEHANSLFASRKYKQAIEKYASALNLCTTPDSHDVFFSLYN